MPQLDRRETGKQRVHVRRQPNRIGLRFVQLFSSNPEGNSADQ